MTATLFPTPPTAAYTRKRWAMRECEALVRAGVLEPGRYELIAGDIVPKVSQGRLRIHVVTRLLAILSAIFGADHLQSQAQVGIGALSPDAESDPEPDAAVLVGTTADYLTREPNPTTEVRLVAEASDSTLAGDLTVKAAIYARAGIPEYWVVDIPNLRLIVHCAPTAAGYGVVTVHTAADTLSPLAAPAAPVRVADLLP